MKDLLGYDGLYAESKDSQEWQAQLSVLFFNSTCAQKVQACILSHAPDLFGAQDRSWLPWESPYTEGNSDWGGLQGLVVESSMLTLKAWGVLFFGGVVYSDTKKANA